MGKIFTIALLCCSSIQVCSARDTTCDVTKCRIDRIRAETCCNKGISVCCSYAGGTNGNGWSNGGDGSHGGSWNNGGQGNNDGSWNNGGHGNNGGSWNNGSNGNSGEGDAGNNNGHWNNGGSGNSGGSWNTEGNGNNGGTWNNNGHGNSGNKAGSCPSYLGRTGRSISQNNGICIRDSDCPAQLKCCYLTQGYQCTRPQ